MRSAPLILAGPGLARIGPLLTRTLAGLCSSELDLGCLGSALFRSRLDRFHVGVGEAEMMADLVHQDVGDERAKRLLVLGPVVDDRPAVEPDHVGELSRYERGPALSQPDAAEKSEKVEGAVVAHLAQGLVVREILHPHHHALAETAEAGGESPESLRGELLELRDYVSGRGFTPNNRVHLYVDGLIGMTAPFSIGGANTSSTGTFANFIYDARCRNGQMESATVRAVDAAATGRIATGTTWAFTC